MKRTTIIAAIFLALLSIATPIWACTTIIIGKDVSTTGRIIVGHNEDDGGRLVVNHGYVPPRDWPEGSVLPAEFFRAEIPQVPHTFGYYWSEVVGVDGGLSFADSFYNDNGVLIMSNSCANSVEDEWDFSTLKDGGIEYNLRRAVAERSKSARDGVEIMIGLIEQWGYAPSGRAYTIADKEEAWLVEIVHGRIYMAIRCPDDQVVVIPNHYNAHNPNDYVQGVLYPENLVSYAKEKGYYKEKEGEFDFALSYQAARSYMTDNNTFRNRNAIQMLTNEPFIASTFPFSVIPDRKIGLQDIISILSSHYEGTEDEPTEEMLSQIPGRAPHNSPRRTICFSTTIESSIYMFEEDPLLTTAWTAFGHPCTLAHIPLHPLAGVSYALGQMSDPASAMDKHLDYESFGDVCHQNGLWQQMRDIQGLFDALYCDGKDVIKSMKEGSCSTDVVLNNEAVNKARAVLPEDRAEARRILATADGKALDRAAGRLYNASLNLNIVQVKVESAPSFSDWNGKTRVTFRLDSEPDTNSIRMGLGSLNPRQYIEAEAVTLADDGLLEAQFSSAMLMDELQCGGSYEYFLTGRLASGEAFSGIVVMDVTE